MKWSPVAALALVCVAQNGAAQEVIVSPQVCSVTGGTPYDVAAAYLDRVQHLQTAGDGLQAFIQSFYEAGVQNRIQTALVPLAERSREVLVWSQAKGAVVEVLMERDALGAQPPRFLAARLVAVGVCPYDVLVENAAKPAVGVGPSPDYRIDEGSSYYLWNTLNPDGTIKSAVVMPGSRGPVRQRALADEAALKLLNGTKKERYRDTVLALAAQAIRVETDAAVRKTIADAAASLADSAARRGKIEADLRDAVEQEKRAAGAVAWIAQLQNVLSLAQLVVHASAMLGPAATSADMATLKSVKDLEQLKGFLGALVTTSSQKRVTHQGQLSLIEVEESQSTQILIDRAEAGGAPTEALPRLP